MCSTQCTLQTMQYAVKSRGDMCYFCNERKNCQWITGTLAYCITDRHGLIAHYRCSSCLIVAARLLRARNGKKDIHWHSHYRSLSCRLCRCS